MREYAEIARKDVKFCSFSDEVKKVVSGMEEFTFSDFEFTDALRLLEEENNNNVIGNKKAPIIRLVAKEI